MRIFLALFLCFSFLLPTLCFARGDYTVRGYYRRDGTYVRPHRRTYPNRTRNDNYTTRGNRNPYTGIPGTRPRDEDLGRGLRFKMR